MLATHVDRKEQRRFIARLKTMRKFFRKNKDRHIFYKDLIKEFDYIIKFEREKLFEMKKYINYPNTHKSPTVIND